MNIFKKNFLEQFKFTLLGICNEYRVIFGLEAETILINNFYEQKLRIKDEQPVSIKNYRIPKIT